MVLGVTAFGFGGGLISVSIPPRTEYGPAVAGRGAISGRFLVGLTGATESPPLVVGFWRVAVDGAAVLAEALDEPETARVVRGGEKCAMADPGLTGRFFAARAFFWAIMVSLSDGLGAPIVLRERPRPGRAAGSAFFGVLGLFGSLSSDFCVVGSKVAISLEITSVFNGYAMKQLEGQHTRLLSRAKCRRMSRTWPSSSP